MKTKRIYKRKNQTRRKNTKYAKKAGFFSFRNSKVAPQGRDWAKEIRKPMIDADNEISDDEEDSFIPTIVEKKPLAKYDPFDEKEKQKIIDAYNKVGIEQKKENTDSQTMKDAKEILMKYKDDSPCLVYDSYVQARAEDNNLLNYKKVLDKRLNNLKNDTRMKPFKKAVEGITKCTSFFRSPFKTTIAKIKRDELIKEGERQEEIWNTLSGGKRITDKRRTRKRRNKKQ